MLTTTESQSSTGIQTGTGTSTPSGSATSSGTGSGTDSQTAIHTATGTPSSTSSQTATHSITGTGISSRSMRHGLVPEDYARHLEYKSQKVALQSDNNGYRFELTPPVPVTVLHGDVRGNAKAVKSVVPLNVVP